MPGVSNEELPLVVMRALDMAICILGDTRVTGTSPDAIQSCTPSISALTALVTGYVLANALGSRLEVFRRVYADMRLASDWAVALDPCRKPLRARDEIFNKAVEQITLVLLEIASDGVKDSSKESISVVRSDKDLS